MSTPRTAEPAEFDADNLDQTTAEALDRMADLSAEMETRGPWGCSVRPGAYKRIRAVAAVDWASTVHAMIDSGCLDDARRRTVSVDYLHPLVEALAAAADYSNGRNCMPGHEELGELLGRPIKPATLAALAVMTPAAAARAWARIRRDRARQVSNALTVLRRAGVLRCVEQGRMLSLVDRLELYANGVHRRRARAVYALTLPRDRQLERIISRRPRDNRPADTRPAGSPATNGPGRRRTGSDIFCPPRSGKESSLSSFDLEVSKSFVESSEESGRACGQHPQAKPRLTAENNTQDAAPRRLASKRRALWELERGHHVLVTGLRSALPDQLGGVSVRKLAGSTKRFYELGWDALSLATAVHEAYDRLGKPFPRYRPGNPAAWLGWILRQVDQYATPALRRYDHFVEAGPDTESCPHDVPGGARLSLVTGLPRCPLCRHAWNQQC